jgi:hypothetical protein
MLKLVIAAAFASLAACGVEPVETSTDTADLSASEVTHTYYSDASFTHEIGYVTLNPDCTAGKRSSGVTSSKFYVVDSVACRTGSMVVSCYEWRDYSGTGDGDFVQVECPSSVF